jgi:hypothetical protein
VSPPCFCRTCSRRFMAHRVELLRCEGSDAMETKRTCRERRERVDLTKMTLTGNAVCVAAFVTMLIFLEGGEQSPSLRNHWSRPMAALLMPVLATIKVLV